MVKILLPPRGDAQSRPRIPGEDIADSKDSPIRKLCLIKLAPAFLAIAITTGCCPLSCKIQRCTCSGSLQFQNFFVQVVELVSIVSNKFPYFTKIPFFSARYRFTKFLRKVSTSTLLAYYSSSLLITVAQISFYIY